MLMKRAGYRGLRKLQRQGLVGLPDRDRATAGVKRVAACNPASPAAMSGRGGQAVLRDSAGTSASELAP
jgi:hypothetical protein